MAAQPAAKTKQKLAAPAGSTTFSPRRSKRPGRWSASQRRAACAVLWHLPVRRACLALPTQCPDMPRIGHANFYFRKIELAEHEIGGKHQRKISLKVPGGAGALARAGRFAANWFFGLSISLQGTNFCQTFVQLPTKLKMCQHFIMQRSQRDEICLCVHSRL